MSRDMIEKGKKVTGFNGDESTKDLVFYLISKLDDFIETNNCGHASIYEAINSQNERIVKNEQKIDYHKLFLYGIMVVTLFILGKLFLL